MTIRRDYAAWTTHSGFARLPDRSQLEITGRDRAGLLHGLCTNDIKRLQPGEGCEAFLTNGQGKTIGYVYVFCGENALWLDSVPGQAAPIRQALDRYVIREDVRFRDLTEVTTVWLIGGLRVNETLAAIGIPSLPLAPLSHVHWTWQGVDCVCRQVPLAGSGGFQIVAPRDATSAIESAWREAGATELPSEVLEVLRVEAGSPHFGQDVTEDNLPQEVNRVAETISFRKGCYLGQETVARLDALGHVNRLLCLLRWNGSDLPPPGAVILHEEKPIARLTSVVWSERHQGPLALGYVRRGFNDSGTRFPTPWGEAEVIARP